MSQTKKRFDRVLAMLLSVLMLLAIMPFNTVFALGETASTITTDLESIYFTVNEASEFTVTSTANDDAGKMVKGSFTFSKPSAIEKLEYYETTSGMEGWYELSGDFGPATGFPIINGTSKFRVKFNTAGDYSVTVSLKDVTTSDVYCSTTVGVTVKDKAGTITSDIASKSFIYNQATEFTVTTIANDDADKMVKGSFVFTDNNDNDATSSIEKLEYYETASGMEGWYQLNGDFGPATGSPMINGTSKFRVTFNKVGDYKATISIKEVSSSSVLCSVEAAINVGKADIDGITVSPTSNKYNAGEDFDLATVEGLVTGDVVSCSIEGDSNSYSAIPKKSAVGEYKVTVNVTRDANHNVFTKTVTSKIELGELDLGNIKVVGLEGEYSGIPQNAVTVSGAGDYTLKYQLGEGQWLDTIPTVTDASSYTVNVKATKTSYNDKDVADDKAASAVYPFNVYIAKTNQTGFAFENSSVGNLAFDSTATYTAAGGQSDGAVSYEVTEGNDFVTVNATSGEIKAIKAGGTAKIVATKAGNSNYKDATTYYTVSTIKANQTGFAFENSSYSVQYGTKELTVKAVGGQSNGEVSYEVVSGDAGTIVSENNEGKISFVSGKKSSFTVKATLNGGTNYNDATDTVSVEVKTNDFSSKYTVDPTVPTTGWYTDSVTVKSLTGYKIATSGQFDTEWKDKIDVVTEGKNTLDPIYLKEIETGYISEAITVDDIYIDKTNPTSLDISYSTSIKDVILETISFGFYKANMTVTLKATDYVSKIDHLVYKIGNQDSVTIDKANLTFEGENNETAKYSFTISPNLSRSKITLTAFDKSGRSYEITGDKTLVVDNTAPAITVSFDNNDSTHESYFKNNRKATITVSEENFFKDNLYDEFVLTEGQTEPKKYLTITVEKRLNNETDYTKSVVEPTFTKDGDVYKATVEFNEEADYKFDIEFYDYSQNKASVDYGESKAPTAFTIDKTKPDFEITYDDADATVSPTNAGYYQGKRVMKFKVTEHNFDPSELTFTEFTSKDVKGNAVNAEQITGFINMLQNPASWTHNGDEHTANITIDKDADYSIKLNYSDLANNAGDQETSSFCLDNTKPYVVKNAEISYSTSILDTVLNAITFGFYKTDVTVTITAYDDTASIDYFTYSYTVDYSNDKQDHEEEVGNTNDSGKQNVIIPNNEITFTENGKKATATFTIPAQFRGYVSFTSTDKSGNTSELFRDKKCIVVDNVAPGVNVTYNNDDVKNSKYYKADRTATISISADNFFKDYLYTPIDGKAGNENYLVITVQRKYDNETQYTDVVKQPSFVKDGDVYKATVDFNENADYTFDIKYTDKSHNVYDSYQKDVFTIDKTNPTVDVVFTEPAHSNQNQYREDRTATITIVDHNFDAKDVVANVTATQAQGTVFDFAKYLKDNKNWQSTGDTHVATITFSTEAHYTFDIKYSDLAGNTFDSYDAVSFTVDKTAPTGMDIKIDNVSVAGNMNTFAFDKFYTAEPTVGKTVKLSANFDISGVESLKYQKVAKISDYNAEGNWETYNNTEINILPSEKFVIYFRAEDKAGNVAIIRSTGIVVDDQKPEGENNAPEITILPTSPNNNDLHKSDVKVDIKAFDPKYIGAVRNENGYYSGLNKITYKISTLDTDAVEEGTLLDVASNKTSGSIIDSDNLINSWFGNITINSDKFNSNNIVIEITAVDNAGNERVSTNKSVKIDVTKPTIDISYNNNDADSNSFFKSNRTATIVVTERNFKAEDVVIKITNTDGSVPSITNWVKTSGNGNLDNTKWTTTIPYTADGDYKFSIEYTDLAENKCDGAAYAEGTVAATEFTIDKVLPTINVSYDNNNAQNSNYYKENRTATVVITEHNFNSERVTVTLKATDDGKDISIPTVNGWASNGDSHTATIAYNADGYYTFDITVKDKAGNDSADFTEQAFYVDKTVPTLEITGVADHSANNGDIIPVVSYSDTNYDDSKVKITLTGAVRKAVELEGAYSDQHNGKVFTFKNFAKEKAIDDIYTLTATLTDKAGNTTEKTITFSANRFGSTYKLSDSTEKLNGTYVKKSQDVVVTETNANELKNIKITLFKNSETIVLKENEDYKIDVKGGNGNWYEYTYTVFAKNFADDGVYRLAFHSEDSAGNVAENTLDTKDKELGFGVDKTLPNIIVTNLESGKTYPVEKLTVKMSADDNLILTSLTVYFDDYNKAYKTWSEKELAEIIDKNGEFTFDVLGDSTSSHKVKVVATDAAGNEKIEEITDFYVTTNLWVRYYTNKPLFFGSISGVVAITGLIIFFVLSKRKKEKNQ